MDNVTKGCGCAVFLWLLLPFVVFAMMLMLGIVFALVLLGLNAPF